ncbi:MAG: hypothetical protein Q7S23_01720 [bacterium]|nr:hypothetical protein [bacterium]
MRPWRAYKSLEWFIFTGFAMAGFFALVAVMVLALKIPGQRMFISWISAPTAATAPASSPLDTSGWKTYRNERYGYEIRYPAWLLVRGVREAGSYEGPTQVTANDAYVQFTYTTPERRARVPFNITVVSIAQALTVEGFLKPPYYNSGHTRRQLEDMQIDGHTAEVVEDCSDIGCFATALLNTPDFQYQISVPVGNNGDDEALQQTMLGTLRFTQTSALDTTGWQTYRNERYGFEFSYPPDLVVVDTNQYRNGTYDLLVSNYLGEELTFCEAEPNSPRCEKIDMDGAVGIITWPTDEEGGAVSVEVEHAKPVYLELNLGPGKTPDLFRQILATLKFIP